MFGFNKFAVFGDPTAWQQHWYLHQEQSKTPSFVSTVPVVEFLGRVIIPYLPNLYSF